MMRIIPEIRVFEADLVPGAGICTRTRNWPIASIELPALSPSASCLGVLESIRDLPNHRRGGTLLSRGEGW